MFFLLGIEPGETSLHILDSDGNTILQTAIVVVPTAERTVTVNRANNLEEATYSCSPRCDTVGTGATSPTGGGGGDAAAESGGDEATTDSDAESTTGG